MPSNEILLSVASVWEVAIKVGLGRLRIDPGVERFIDRQVVRNRFTILPIILEHAARVSVLPSAHKDPFDRLLIAQAHVERVPIVTRDPAFAAYDVEVIW